MQNTIEAEKRGKIVFVVGQESSGSRLVAKACASSLGIVAFDEWNAIGWAHGDGVSVCHRSLPFGTPPKFPSIQRWIRKYGAENDLLFVLTTRDVNLSDISKMEAFGKSSETVKAERDKARDVYKEIVQGDHPYWLFSYETLMFLGDLYWGELYTFLGVEPEDQVFPALIDANAKRISDMHPFTDTPTSRPTRAKRLARGSVRRLLDWTKGEAD